MFISHSIDPYPTLSKGKGAIAYPTLLKGKPQFFTIRENKYGNMAKTAKH